MGIFRRFGLFKKKRGEDNRRRGAVRKKRETEQVELNDVEAPRTLAPRKRREAMHGMNEPSGSFKAPLIEVGGADTPARLAVKAKKLDGLQLDPDDLEEDKRFQKALIVYLVKEAKSMADVTAAMDEHIDDDWLGGIDELPGNVYRIIAFGGLNTLHWGDLLTFNGIKHWAEKLGLFAIFLIQLYAPPAVFLCNVYGKGVEHVLQWDQKQVGLFAGWTCDEKCNIPYKIVSVLFIFLFCLNALSSSMDEADSWDKIHKMFKFMNIPDDGNKWALKLDAFMNIWVVFWAVLDVFIVLLAEDSISDVLFDALSIAFLFNLDDIGGDLSFFGADDWPGVQLGWVAQNMYAIAAEDDEIAEPHPSVIVNYCYNAIAAYLMAMVFILPTVFIFMNVPEKG